MPAKSGKQYRYAQMIAHGKVGATGGMTKGVAREMIDATPKGLRSEYAKKKKKKY